MTQDVDASPNRDTSPLLALLQQDDDIEWASWGALPLIANFAQPQIEYAALHKGAGLIYRSELGLLELRGKDRLEFLNNLLTQGLKSLPAGRSTRAMLLNLKGRIAAVMQVVNLPGGEATWLVMPRNLVEPIRQTLDAYLFAEDVTMSDVSGEFDLVQMHGPMASDVLTRAADVAFERETDASVSVKIAGQGVTVFDGEPIATPSLTLAVPTSSSVSLWNDLTTRFGQTGDNRQFGQRPLTPTGWAMFNARRIEAGLPIAGVDFALARPSKPGPKSDDDTDPKGTALPAETGPLFDLCVSTTSGCYLGQEVVARMHARNVVAKQLVGLKMREDALPSAGEQLEFGDTSVGVVTSSTLSPIQSGACIALATLKRPHFEPGTVLSVVAEGRKVEAEVVAIPFMA